MTECGKPQCPMESKLADTALKLLFDYMEEARELRGKVNELHAQEHRLRAENAALRLQLMELKGPIL